MKHNRNRKKHLVTAFSLVGLSCVVISMIWPQAWALGGVGAGLALMALISVGDHDD